MMIVMRMSVIATAAVVTSVHDAAIAAVAQHAVLTGIRIMSCIEATVIVAARHVMILSRFVLVNGVEAVAVMLWHNIVCVQCRCADEYNGNLQSCVYLLTLTNIVWLG